MKTDILEYLDAGLDKLDDQYEIAIEWDKKNWVIEILFRLFIENKAQHTLIDQKSVESDFEVIEFIDGIALYNPAKGQVAEDDFLATFEIDGKKGVEKRLLDAILAYLPEVIEDTEDSLIDFMNDEEAEDFVSTFDETRFDDILSEFTDSTMIPYPKF
ncbi:MAG: DUF3013 family protein [Lactobacillales bacterium]|jgi:hypothetical protein|nr:DUF3013 family protein [Lactobacillales bacterium]